MSLSSKILLNEFGEEKTKKKNLVICESPAKIKKIQEYLGPNYIVKASFGHIRDLKKKSLSVDLENNFRPTYEISEGKQKVVSELKNEMKKCNKLLLASDFDREGESIAWHIQNVLKIPTERTQRIIFTEITKKALMNSIKNPSKLDINMFFSQQARRILDRLIGFLISPLLWKEIQSSYKEKISLSAGRVQSIVVKIIIDREKLIEDFQSQSYYKIQGCFKIPLSSNNNILLNGDFSEEMKEKEELNKLFKIWKLNNFFIKNVCTKKTKRNPPKPFITSTLQQDASLKLGMSPKETMSLAQKLYEGGFITYMRTDSLTLSKDALNGIQKIVKKHFGDNYFNETKYTNKDKNSQEAHEACRPCNFKIFNLDDNDDFSNRANRLYKLIWGRTMMSQMKPADMEIYTINIGFKDEKEKKYTTHFTSKKEFILFEGFLAIEGLLKKEQNDIKNMNEEKETLKKIEIDKKCSYLQIDSKQKYSKPSKARFTEASLIKHLDELGIGRPSTYSSMITTVQDRKYVEKKNLKGKDMKVELLKLEKGNITEKKEQIKIGADKNKLIPTQIGYIVNKFLLNKYPEIINEKFTVYIEEQLDLIASGEKPWTDIVGEIYNIIKLKLPEQTQNVKEKDKYKRVLGKCPNTGLEVITYIGKYGPLVQLKGEGEKNKFGPIGDIKMEDITLELALEILKYPFNMGKYEGKQIQLNKGQYGLYLKYDKNNYSFQNDDDPTLEEAIEIIKLKNKTSVERKIGDVSIKNGKYGSYFQYNGKNYSIPKSYDPEKITMNNIQTIIKNKKEWLEKNKNKK